MAKNKKTKKTKKEKANIPVFDSALPFIQLEKLSFLSFMEVPYHSVSNIRLWGGLYSMYRYMLSFIEMTWYLSLSVFT